MEEGITEGGIIEVLKQYPSLVWENMNFATWVVVIGIFLWFGILLTAIGEGTEKSDVIAGITYVLYCTAAGVTIFFAIPGTFRDTTDFPFHLLIAIIIASTAAYRWYRDIRRSLIINIDMEVTEKESVSPKGEAR